MKDQGQLLSHDVVNLLENIQEPDHGIPVFACRHCAGYTE